MKTAIVGSASHVGMTAALSRLQSEGHEVVLVDKDSLAQMNQIEINGVLYEERQRPTHRHSAATLKVLAMAAAFGITAGTKSYTGPRVNLVEEFKLIQQKKSSLSARDRQWVVNQFNQAYQLVKTPR